MERVELTTTEASRPTCFIIQPITTPVDLAKAYGNDSEHFIHVMEWLFVPALERLGYEPILPTSTGADIIHAQIIRQLEIADLVLCDISTLNANVFFELGIRTAINKPVCLVKDDLCPHIPFDTAPINCHTYDSSLVMWKAREQLKSLERHIAASATGDGQNGLWRYFGLTTKASFEESDRATTDEKIDFLLQELSRLASPSSYPSALNITASSGARQFLQVVSGDGPIPSLSDEHSVSAAGFLLERLQSDTERQVLRLRFGLDGLGRSRSLEHVARLTAMPASSARATEARSIQFLREHNCLATALLPPPPPAPLGDDDDVW